MSQLPGADPGKMKGGASRKGRSPVRGWVWEGEHPSPASPEAKFFDFYNLLTLFPLNCHINKSILNMKKLIRSNQQKDLYCRCYIYIHALLVHERIKMPTKTALRVREGKTASLQ